MKYSLNVAFLLVLVLVPGLVSAQVDSPRPPTFCNPLDLDYRFQLKEPSHREAADPTVVRFKGEYWIFASKSGGYWHSKDFSHWEFVAASGLPLEDYAPTVEAIGGKLYFTAGGSKALFTTNDPATGQWTKAADAKNYSDPDLFVDDDGRVYMFYGCSDREPIRGVELDPNAGFSEIGEPTELFGADVLHHGWELKDPAATDDLIVAKKVKRPYIEGAWMTKRGGIYYLQYSAPGTEMKWYGDGVYLSEHPLGPYRYAPYSPFSLRATGFLGSAGHGSTFRGGDDNYWHAASSLIGVKKMFERRLSVFPAGFVSVGAGGGPDQLVSQSYLGDYPQYVPGVVPHPLDGNTPGWMLLSLKKTAKASSFNPAHPPELAFDEDIRTWWSAATGDPGEWLGVDLGKKCRIEAMQVNFADEGSTVLGKMENDAYRYVVEVSDDEKTWTPCISRKDNLRDAPHEYVQLDQPVMARYVRLTNVHAPGGACFSVSGLRIFGDGLGAKPDRVEGLTAQRMPEKRRAALAWKPVANADFYIVRYGIAPDRLYLNAQVYDRTDYDLPGLNTDVAYYATVDAVNDSGVTLGTQVVPVQ